jgi:hypothetical protein
MATAFPGYRAVVLAVLAALVAVPRPAFAQPCVSTNDVSGTVGALPEWSVDLVYDTANSRTLALSLSPSDHLGAQVYAYNGQHWSIIPRAGQLPPGQARFGGAWVFDSARGEALLFGGEVEINGPLTNTLYAFVDTAWTQRTWTGVSPPSFGGSYGTFDPIRNRAIFLCQVSLGSDMYRSWEWTGTSWEGGPFFGPVTPTKFIFDSVRNVGFLYASTYDPAFGLSFDDVWELTPAPVGAPASAGVWNRIPISGPRTETRISTNLTYDPYRGRILRCFGRGSAPTGYGPDIQVWDSSNRRWSIDTSLWIPFDARRGACGVTYDTSRDKLVINGGARVDQGGVFVPYYDTWEQSVGTPGIASSTSGFIPVCEGQPVILAVATVGSPDIQWLRNSQPVPGANSPTLLLSPSTPEQSGTYQAFLSNACGTYFGPVTYVRVDSPPTFASAAIWPGCTTCPGATASIISPTLSAASASGPALLYHLQKLSGGTWSDVQTAAPGSTFTLSNLQRSDSGDYRILVDGNACAPVVASSRRIEVGVSFDVSPQSQTVAPCGVATFSVQARGTCIRAYQWLRNGTPLADNVRLTGSQTSTLTLARCRYDDEALYSCIVSDFCEARESTSASLLLTSPVWTVVPMNVVPGSTIYAQSWTGAFDESRNVYVLYGGVTLNQSPSNSLLEYDGNSWIFRQDGYPGTATNLAQPLYLGFIPPNPAASAMVYDADLHKVLLITDIGQSNPMSIYTWDGTAWQRPYFGPVMGGSSRTLAAYDRASHRTVIIRSTGGGTSSDAFFYDSATNTLTGPLTLPAPMSSAAAYGRLIYDERRATVIWYSNAATPLMYALFGSTWLQLASPLPVPGFTQPTRMAYDPVRGQIATMGGFIDGTSWFTGTYVWPWSGARFSAALTNASDWNLDLPSGAPSNPAGALTSPPSTWSVLQGDTAAFDRRRRAMIVPGLDGLSIFQGPVATWKTYERRYLDAPMFDRPTVREPQPGNVVRFVAYAAGAGPLSYRWQRNGVDIADGPAIGGGTISGAHARILTITGTTPATTGNYTCLVANTCSSITSTPASPTNCPADFNGSGMLEVQDIFDFLNAWLGSDPQADFNGSGMLEVQDIFDFLNAWLAGCP